jgi:hypothetical protein
MNEVNAAPPAQSEEFFRMVGNGGKFGLFLLGRLPAAYFSGLRVVSANAHSCSVSVPFKWFTQNPFRSTYFACLSMAAEMTTGLLAMAHIHKRKPSVSMLITANSANFHKKATGVTVFTCNDGIAIGEAIRKSIETGVSETFTARSIGVNANGELVAEFLFTWSFKVKAQ